MVLYLNTGNDVNLHQAQVTIAKLSFVSGDDYTDSLLSMIHAVMKYISAVGMR